jgi:Arc/MetJ-type ribon-helix-helix transcriptional regulator
MAKVEIEFADALLDEIRRCVQAGDFQAEFVREGLRYYLDRHREEDWEEYVRKEVAWSRRHAG